MTIKTIPQDIRTQVKMDIICCQNFHCLQYLSSTNVGWENSIKELIMSTLSPLPWQN